MSIESLLPTYSFFVIVIRGTINTCFGALEATVNQPLTLNEIEYLFMQVFQFSVQKCIFCFTVKVSLQLNFQNVA